MSFTLNGTFDWATGAVEFAKQHTGKFTTLTEHTGRIVRASSGAGGQPGQPARIVGRFVTTKRKTGEFVLAQTKAAAVAGGAPAFASVPSTRQRGAVLGPPPAERYVAA